ncbi:PhzF family phenazine biosynthesis protein [Nonomuraea sp. NPDC003707]
MLIPVPTASDLAALTPDLDRLRQATDRLGLLGCYLYTVPTKDGRAAARMLAPSIGVPEDIADANSTACLAAHLSRQGFTTLTVDMGDSLSCPSSITATTETSPAGVLVDIGGIAIIRSSPLSEHCPPLPDMDRLVGAYGLAAAGNKYYPFPAIDDGTLATCAADLPEEFYWMGDIDATAA